MSENLSNSSTPTLLRPPSSLLCRKLFRLDRPQTCLSRRGLSVLVPKSLAYILCSRYTSLHYAWRLCKEGRRRRQCRGRGDVYSKQKTEGSTLPESPFVFCSSLENPHGRSKSAGQQWWNPIRKSKEIMGGRDSNKEPLYGDRATPDTT